MPASNACLPSAIYSRCAQGIDRKKTVGVAAQREAVQFLVEQGIATHRACVLLDLQRSTFYYQSRPDHNAELEQHLRELAEKHPRYGYRRMRSRLQVPKRTRKRRRRGGAGTLPVKALHPGHVWTYDFIHDHCLNGTKLKLLTVMDEFTREGLAIEVATSLPSRRVIAVLADLFAQHGAPQFIRSDNGPEFIAQALRDWLAQHQTETLYIDPGCPWQNGFGESVGGTVRDECLNMHAFASVAEARVILAAFRHQYNEERPHSSLGYRTPADVKRDWRNDQSTGQDSNIAT
jgi:putative transposase